jgi:hypothetical protein
MAGGLPRAVRLTASRCAENPGCGRPGVPAAAGGRPGGPCRAGPRHATRDLGPRLLAGPRCAPWDRPATYQRCHRRRLGAGGPRLRRRGQPAPEHRRPASAGTVLRHRLPTPLRSSHDCAACRRSAPPRCGWKRLPPTPSRRPRSQLLCSWSCRWAAPGSMVARWPARGTREDVGRDQSYGSVTASTAVDLPRSGRHARCGCQSLAPGEVRRRPPRWPALPLG